MGWHITSVSLSLPIFERRINGVRYMRMEIRELYKHSDILQQQYDYIVNLGGYVDHH